MEWVVVLVVILLAAAVVAAIVLWLRKRSQTVSAPTAQPTTADGAFSAAAIKVGDVVTISGTDHLVVGSVRYEEEGFVWHEHVLEDEERTWLSVEDDDGRIVTVLWGGVKGSGLSPTGDRVVHDDTVFAFNERGEATYTASGSTGLPAAGRMQYADYAASDGSRLGFERFTGTGTWEVAAGIVVDPLDLHVWARPVGG